MPLFVTVSPGTTVTNSTTLDAATLNLLGTPSVDVVGTVDGGSLSLSNGSVTASAIALNAVTNARMAQMDANTIKGNNGGSPANPLDLTVPQVKTMLKVNPAGGLENSGDNIQIANGQVSYAKIQNVAASRLLGNPTNASASASEITLGTGLSFSGTVLNARSRFDILLDGCAYKNGDSNDWQQFVPMLYTGTERPDSKIGLWCYPCHFQQEYLIFSTDFIPTSFVASITRQAEFIPGPNSAGFKIQYATSTSGPWNDASSVIDLKGATNTHSRLTGAVSISGSPSVIYYRLLVSNPSPNVDDELIFIGFNLSLIA